MSRNNTADTVEVSRETLAELRGFADAYAYEYGNLKTYQAIIDAGVVLGRDDPMPEYPMPKNVKGKIRRQIIAAHLPLTDVETKSGSMDQE